MLAESDLKEFGLYFNENWREEAIFLSCCEDFCYFLARHYGVWMVHHNRKESFLARHRLGTKQDFDSLMVVDDHDINGLPKWAKERVHVVTPALVMEVGRQYELWYGSAEKGDGCRSNCAYITLETCFLRDDGSRVWMARQAHTNTLFDSQGKEVYCDGHRKPYYLKSAQ